MDAIRPAVAERSVGALERLNRFFEASRAWSLSHLVLLKEMLIVLYRDENIHMRRKIEARTSALTVPLLADILRQGMEEGVFDPLDCEETAFLILQMAWVMRETNMRQLAASGHAPETFAAMQRRVDDFIARLERMLAAPKFSIDRPQVTDPLQPDGSNPSATDASGAAVAK
jgi:hypothetical protein